MRYKYIGNDDPIKVDSFYLGDLKSDQEGEWQEIPYSSYSDYSGCCVERSNFRCILEDFEDDPRFKSYYGGYGTMGLVVNRTAIEDDEEIKDMIESLLSYPVYNDDDLTELEFSMDQEAYDEGGRDRFLEYLRESLTPSQLLLLEYDPELEIDAFFWNIAYEDGIFIHECGASYIPDSSIEDIASKLINLIRSKGNE